MRTYNRSLILRLIRLHQPVSRVELAKATSLTKPTISNIVNELKEEGLINERELGVSSGVPGQGKTRAWLGAGTVDGRCHSR